MLSRTEIGGPSVVVVVAVAVTITVVDTAKALVRLRNYYTRRVIKKRKQTIHRKKHTKKSTSQQRCFQPFFRKLIPARALERPAGRVRRGRRRRNILSAVIFARETCTYRIRGCSLHRAEKMLKFNRIVKKSFEKRASKLAVDALLSTKPFLKR